MRELAKVAGVLGVWSALSCAPSIEPVKHVYYQTQHTHQVTADQLERLRLTIDDWHQCPGTGFYCLQNYVCVHDGCEWWGDPNGPGAGDADHDGSWAGQVQ